MRRYGRTSAVASIDLPAPVELRASNACMQLRLFNTTLNREQDGREVRYYYAAEWLLEITP